MDQTNAERGARNLLENCANAQNGDRLLVAYEPASFGYFDTPIVEIICRVARSMGLVVDAIDVGFNPDNPHLTQALLERFEAADIILFLARLGDQLRFSEMPPGKKVIVSFAVNQELLGSRFGTGDHNAFLDIKSGINTVLDNAARVHISCPLGTDVSGHPVMNLQADGDTSILRFPMSVFTPVPATGFSGRVAMTFLTGTGSKYYEDYHIDFDEPVFAILVDGRLQRFEGATKDVEKAEAHYDRVAALFNIDREFVHSWHAGIHPGCGYPWDMHENVERWGGAAFGNPRILHFHTCGAYAPGEISWNVIDATITIDEITFWDKGIFHAERLPDGPDILRRYPSAAEVFSDPARAIGLPDTL